MNYKYNTRRSRQGFTMMELLIVVAIIGILAAIAMPNIIALRKNLEMAKLDEYARQIYLSAQNETMKMKASGQLLKFYEELDDKYTAWSLGPAGINTRPLDYPDDDSTATWKLLYYISSEEDVTKDFFLNSSSSLATMASKDDCFIMEMNPLTGDIYSVFYAERKISYQTDVTGLASRSRQDRTPSALGYYCGSASNTAATLPGEFHPTVELLNGETLTAKITCPDMIRVMGTQRKLKLEVTVEEEGQPDNKWTRNFSGGTSDLLISGDTVEIPVLLDSYDEDKRFSKLTDNKITPGKDIRVKAVFTYKNGDIEITGSAEAVDNSLFSYIRSKDGGNEIGIGSVRHLNNLRKSRYEYTDTKSVIISQINNLDFKNVESDDADPVFAPIENDTLFQSPETTYDGHFNELINFKIETSGSPSTGLFGTVKYSTLQNIRIIDGIVTSSSADAGMLAGTVSFANILNCGAYLTTKDAFDRHQNMEDRVELYKITNSSSTGSTGGLIGTASDSLVQDCFSAVWVNGTSQIGGLIGNASVSTIDNCYSSGSVKAAGSTAGGLTAVAVSTNIINSYSTCNVSAQNICGGLIGHGNNISVKGSVSYGMVENKPSAGGFIASNSGGNTYENCSYLKQGKYNDWFPASSITGIHDRYFRELKSETVNLIEHADPYDNKLVKSAFPFPLLITRASEAEGTKIPMIHYGNWPTELNLQTSLVYYEKYEDNFNPGSYGFYAETSLTTSNDSEENASNKNVNTWKIDTLQDRTCIEDGYAIMTPFDLSEFNYQLNADRDTSTPVENVKIGTGKGDAILLFSKASLTFESTDEEGQKLEYVVSNVNIYRLPFALQMTNRYTAARFYDQLKMTGIVDKNTVFENYVFYYCPDFAKNAINPTLDNATDLTPPKDPDNRKKEDGSYNNERAPFVYVRSARQLNALGRTPYYWNEINNKAEDHNDGTEVKDDLNNDAKRVLYFTQETDIDFGTYVKNYCGVAFDLMNTLQNNDYRNRPIGRTNEEAALGSNFRYTYNGNGNAIIDFRCETYPTDKNRFTGLFGEIQGGSLENIVMKGSGIEGRDPYVISHFQNGLIPGVGALVGLVFVKGSYPKDYPESNSVATVKNCTVSGYRVSYDGNRDNAVVGGLAGLSFGIIENSSVVNRENNLTLTKNKPNGKIFLAGLVGTLEGKAIVRNCYSGGEFTINCRNFNGSASNIGGISAGNANTAGANTNKPSPQIINSYSYCTLKKGSSNLDDSKLKRYGVAPVELNSEHKTTINNCYYLNDLVNDDLLFENTGDHSKGMTFKELSNLTALADPFGKAFAHNTFPWPEDEDALGGSNYPFPAVVTTTLEDGSTDYIHYGSWPTKHQASVAAYLCYYEQYEDDTFGLYYYDEKGSEHRSLDDENEYAIRKDENRIEHAGYGVLCPKELNFTFHHENGTASSGSGGLQEGIMTDGDLNLYPFKEEFIEKYLKIGYIDQATRKIGISYPNEDNVTVFRYYYININFAAQILLEENGSKRYTPEIRTAIQLQNISSYNKQWEFRQTHDIIAEEKTGLINNNTGGFRYNGMDDLGTQKENKIINLRLPLFNINGGILENLLLTEVNINRNDNVAALAVTNNGTITNTHASGTIVSTNGNAAGLVLTNNTQLIKDCSTDVTISASNNGSGFLISNQGGSLINCKANARIISAATASGFANVSSGPIQYCSADAAITAVNALNSAGFIYTNHNTIDRSYANCISLEGKNVSGFATEISGGTVINCFSIGKISASQNASGFAMTNTGTVTSSYANCDINGKNAAAFLYTRSGGSVYNCYAVGSVTASDMASGFVYDGHASIKDCYSVAETKNANIRIGFAGNNDAVENCYWVLTETFNHGAADGSPAKKLSSFGPLMTSDTDESVINSLDPTIWSLGSTGHTHPGTDMSGDYPYPMLVNLDHYGNWPVGPAAQ